MCGITKTNAVNLRPVLALLLIVAFVSYGGWVFSLYFTLSGSNGLWYPIVALLLLLFGCISSVLAVVPHTIKSKKLILIVLLGVLTVLLIITLVDALITVDGNQQKTNTHRITGIVVTILGVALMCPCLVGLGIIYRIERSQTRHAEVRRVSVTTDEFVDQRKSIAVELDKSVLEQNESTTSSSD